MSPTAPTSAQLGQAIRRLRQDRRLSIEDLAGTASWHPTYLSAVERRRRNPTWTKFCGMAEALGITVSKLAWSAENEVLVTNLLAARARLAPHASSGGHGEGAPRLGEQSIPPTI
jgi:transcriptional regulator with XRE-family HTH domain